MSALELVLELLSNLHWNRSCVHWPWARFALGLSMIRALSLCGSWSGSSCVLESCSNHHAAYCTFQGTWFETRRCKCRPNAGFTSGLFVDIDAIRYLPKYITAGINRAVLIQRCAHHLRTAPTPQQDRIEVRSFNHYTVRTIWTSAVCSVCSAPPARLARLRYILYLLPRRTHGRQSVTPHRR